MLLLLGGTPAYAHTALENATPAPGAKVAAGTDVVALTFKDLKSGVPPKIGMVAAGGTTVPVGAPVVADGGTACAAVSPLPVGVVTLTYTVIAGDGDPQTSAFQFEVVDGAKPVEPPSACADLSLPAPDTGGADTILGLGRTTATTVLAGAVAVIAGGGVVAVRRRRRAGLPAEGGTAE
ncbi:copper resistance protein CopC [Streptomyces sp. NPDC088254]|uniref:copper resistance CopC family protein n=1 Tax=Streptomyces sp. NPDC088254 TaxID=3365847 RepID=UPI003818CCE8